MGNNAWYTEVAVDWKTTKLFKLEIVTVTEKHCTGVGQILEFLKNQELILLNIFMNDPGTEHQSMGVKLADDVKLGGATYMQQDQSALQEEWHSSGELNHSNRMQEQTPRDWEQEFL